MCVVIFDSSTPLYIQTGRNYHFGRTFVFLAYFINGSYVSFGFRFQQPEKEKKAWMELIRRENN